MVLTLGGVLVNRLTFGVRPYVLTGIGLVALVAATTAWSTRRGMPQPGETLDFRGVHPDPAAGSTLFLERLTGSAAAVGLPLLVLSRAERGRALLLGALGFAPAELSGKRRVS